MASPNQRRVVAAVVVLLSLSACEGVLIRGEPGVEDSGIVLDYDGGSRLDAASAADGAAPRVDAGPFADAGPATDGGPSGAVCGNGIVEPGETCDPPSSCPTSCDDGVACTTSAIVGDAASCTAECRDTPITTCVNGDGCCPSGCTPVNDDDCEATCGDGVCSGNAGETCPNCPADCNTTEVVCGNGACEAGETSASCYADCGPATWSEDWLAFEEQVLVLLNEHRAAGTACPSGPRSPVGPLTMQSQLQRACQLHSWDLAYSNYTGHPSCNGRHFTARASAQGTNARAEILVYGGSSPAAAVASWMGSDGHCRIIMDGQYNEIGIGFASSSGVLRWCGKLR